MMIPSYFGHIKKKDTAENKNKQRSKLRPQKKHSVYFLCVLDAMLEVERHVPAYTPHLLLLLALVCVFVLTRGSGVGVAYSGCLSLSQHMHAHFSRRCTSEFVCCVVSCVSMSRQGADEKIGWNMLFQVFDAMAGFRGRKLCLCLDVDAV